MSHLAPGLSLLLLYSSVLVHTIDLRFVGALAPTLRSLWAPVWLLRGRWAGFRVFSHCLPRSMLLGFAPLSRSVPAVAVWLQVSSGKGGVSRFHFNLPKKMSLTAWSSAQVQDKK
jgi:hypothetical protein